MQSISKINIVKEEKSPSKENEVKLEFSENRYFMSENKEITKIKRQDAKSPMKGNKKKSKKQKVIDSSAN